MQWFRLELKGGQAEDIDVFLRAAWDITYSDAFLNFRNAVFRRPAPNGAFTLFFSPGARELGETFAAQPCRQPAREGLHLVAGGSRAWDVYYPEAATGGDAPQGALTGTGDRIKDA